MPGGANGSGIGGAASGGSTVDLAGGAALGGEGAFAAGFAGAEGDFFAGLGLARLAGGAGTSMIRPQAPQRIFRPASCESTSST
jgi:hypothetical protein